MACCYGWKLCWFPCILSLVTFQTIWRESRVFISVHHPSRFKDAFESQGNDDLMPSSALRSQTKKLCKYRELQGHYQPQYLSPQYYQGFGKINEEMGPGILAAAVASGKIKRPSILGNVGLWWKQSPKNYFSFFCKWKPPKMKTHCNMKRKELKLLKSNGRGGEGKVLCEGP